jgi:nicotinate-nucleotide adenylyltransferase
MSVALFTGTFDPLHIGHINLVIEMIEKANLKKIIILPSKLSPFKKDKKPIASDIDRLKMLKIAFENIKEVEINDFELKNSSPSYTIDTILKFKKDDDLKLIITEDMLSTFHLWKDFKKILDNSFLLIGSRKHNLNDFKNNHFSLSKKHFIHTKFLDISSSEIRDKISKNKYIYPLMPKEIIDYIYNHKLYY